jgi:hypothetical protein
LGIYVGHEIYKCDELNWEGKINQMKTIIDIFWIKESYHYRKDTNNNITDLTKFTFIACSCTFPERYTKEIESGCL